MNQNQGLRSPATESHRLWHADGLNMAIQLGKSGFSPPPSLIELPLSSEATRISGEKLGSPKGLQSMSTLKEQVGPLGCQVYTQHPFFPGKVMKTGQ